MAILQVLNFNKGFPARNLRLGLGVSQLIKRFKINSGSFLKNYKLADVFVNPLKGFTIIELLVVMSLLGIAATLVSSAYLSYEKRERVKKAALDLESDLRLAQNKALAGDKGIPGSGVECTSSQTLIGWYFNIDTTSPIINYEIKLACQNSPGDEQHYDFKSVELPEGVTISNFWIIVGGSDNAVSTGVYKLLFQPIEREIYIFDNSSAEFFDSNGNYSQWMGFFDTTTWEGVKTRLNGFDTTYDVIVIREGEFNVEKI